MKIGFIKLGLKTYFNSTGTGQGSNHELVDIYDIFEKRDNICIMLSNSDIGQASFPSELNLDFVFVFNGPLAQGYETNMNMLKGTMESLRFLRDHKIPWVYFWTDPRKDYDIRNHDIYIDNPPIAILSQEKEFYGHLDKLILYGKQINDELPKKPYLISVLMNLTDKKRAKKLLSDLNWVKHYDPEIRGNWKKETNPFLKDKIPEDGVKSYLDNVKYSYNINKNPNWVSQKFWEMALSDVICFYANYDNDNLIMPPDDARRVIDGIDLLNKIDFLEVHKDEYLGWIKAQREQILPEYLNGDLIYKTINEKIK